MKLNISAVSSCHPSHCVTDCNHYPSLQNKRHHKGEEGVAVAVEIMSKIFLVVSISLQNGGEKSLFLCRATPNLSPAKLTQYLLSIQLAG